MIFLHKFAINLPGKLGELIRLIIPLSFCLLVIASLALRFNGVSPKYRPATFLLPVSFQGMTATIPLCFFGHAHLSTFVKQTSGRCQRLSPPTHFVRCCPFCQPSKAWGKKAYGNSPALSWNGIFPFSRCALSRVAFFRNI